MLWDTVNIFLMNINIVKIKKNHMVGQVCVIPFGKGIFHYTIRKKHHKGDFSIETEHYQNSG